VIINARNANNFIDHDIQEVLNDFYHYLVLTKYRMWDGKGYNYQLHGKCMNPIRTNINSKQSRSAEQMQNVRRIFFGRLSKTAKPKIPMIGCSGIAEFLQIK